jgi:UDP-perosamine 4-acetyltransferase
MVIDLHYSGKSEDILGLKVEGVKDALSQDLRKAGVEHLFLAIGGNREREELFLDLKNQGFVFPTFIAGTAVKKEGVVYGEGNIVFDKAYIGPLVRMGSNNILNTASIIEHECLIGDHCNIGPGSVISGRATIGNHVFVGTSATVIDKVSISSFVTLGAGAVVVKDINEPGTYIGVPARIKKEG